MNNFQIEDWDMRSDHKYTPVDFIKKDEIYLKDAAFNGATEKKIDISERIYSESTVRYYFKFITYVLLEVIDNLKNQLDFNGHYIAFLLGQINEKEFKIFSKKNIVEKKETSLEILKNKIYIIKNFIGDSETPRDMALYFQCDEEDIQNSLELLEP